MIVLAIQALPRFFFNEYSTFAIIPCTAVPHIWVNLALRNLIPGIDLSEYASEFEQIYFLAIVVSFVINSLTFLQTVLTLPLIHVFFYYIQLRVQILATRNDEDEERVTPDQNDDLFRQRMNGLMAVVILFSMLTWLVQKDIITVVIKNHLVSRQQTELKEYFGAQEDPICVIAEDGSVAFKNESAEVLFRRAGTPIVDPAFPFLSCSQLGP